MFYYIVAMFGYSCPLFFFLILSAPFVDFASCPSPPCRTFSPTPPTPSPPCPTSFPTPSPTPPSREEVEKVVEDMFGTHFQEVPTVFVIRH